jgi:thioredoxin reductase
MPLRLGDDRALRDVIVVGGGPAGLSAAVWAGRYRRSVVAFDAGEQRNRWADESHGYFGFDCADPHELLRRARHDLARYSNVQFCAMRVTCITVERGCFEVHTDSGETWRSLRVVMATGVRDVFPDIDNFFEHYGADVHHCASCDGYEAGGKTAVVVGNGSQVVGFAVGLLDWTASVTIATNGERFDPEGVELGRPGYPPIEVIESPIIEFVGARHALTALRTSTAGTVPCEVAFFTIDHLDHDDLLDSLGCARTSEGCVIVDDDCLTSVAHVYAAGDITPGMHMVQVAAAKGAIAGAAAAQSLRGTPGAQNSPPPAPEPEANNDDG